MNKLSTVTVLWIFLLRAEVNPLFCPIRSEGDALACATTFFSSVGTQALNVTDLKYMCSILLENSYKAALLCFRQIQGQQIYCQFSDAFNSALLQIEEGEKDLRSFCVRNQEFTQYCGPAEQAARFAILMKLNADLLLQFITKSSFTSQQFCRSLDEVFGKAIVELSQYCTASSDVDKDMNELIYRSRQLMVQNKCDNIPSTILCQLDGAATFRCLSPNATSADDPQDQCISLRKVCNGVKDCPNGYDELYCNPSSDGTTCLSGQFACGSKCYFNALRCDGMENCPGGSDEQDCDGSCTTNSTFSCTDGSKCISLEQLCDGVTQCPDKSDESFCIGGPCVDHTFVCNVTGSFTCLRESLRCDLMADCSNSADEQNCTYSNMQMIDWYNIFSWTTTS